MALMDDEAMGIAPPQPTGYGGLAPNFVQAIRGWEGYTPRAKGDGRQYSIGYGTKAQYPGEVIDPAEADRRLSTELDKAGGYVDQRFPNLPPDRRQALVSLTYNAGPGWMNSGLGHAVQNGDWDEAGRRFNMYTNAAGQPNAHNALVTRRNAEWNFGSGDGGSGNATAYAPTQSPMASSPGQTAIQNAMATNKPPMQQAMGQNNMSDPNQPATAANPYSYAPNYDQNAGLFDRMRQGGPGALFGAPNGTFPGANGRAGYHLGNKLQQAAVFGLAVNNPSALGALGPLLSRDDKQVTQIGTDDFGNPKYAAVDHQGNVTPLNMQGGGVAGAGDNTNGGGAGVQSMQDAISSGKHGDELLTSVPPVIANQVKMIDSGAMPYNQAQMSKTPQGRMINAALAAYNPDFTLLDYEQRAKGVKDWASNKNADIIRRGEQASMHASDLTDNYKSLDNTQFPLVNAVKNGVGEQLGWGAPTAARMNTTALANEMGAYVRGNGGSDSSFKEWESNFPQNGSPDQQKAAMGQLAKLWEDSMTSLADKRRMMVGDVQDKRMAPVYNDKMKAAVAKLKAFAAGGSGVSQSGAPTQLPAGVKSIQVMP